MDLEGLRLLGYGEISLTAWERSITPDSWVKLKGLFEGKAFSSGTQSVQLLSANAQLLTLECAMQRVMDEDEQSAYILGLLYHSKEAAQLGLVGNLTNENNIKTVFSTADEKLTKLAALVPGVVYQFQLFKDGRTCFPYASPGIQQIYAVSPEEVREDAAVLFDRLHPDDSARVIADIYKSAADLSIFHCEYRVILPGKSQEWRLSNARPERMPDGSTLWHGIITDITDSVNHLQRIKSLLQVEEEQNKRLRNFTHIVSHNLRSHTANMLGIFSLIELESPDLIKNELIQMVQNSAENLNETITNLNQVLDINRTAKEKLSNIHLNDTIKSALSSVSLLARNAGVTIKFVAESELFLNAIPAYVDSIVLNLITNALKFKATNRAAFTNVSLSKSQSEICMRVEDNGLGIDLDRYGDELFGMYKTFHGLKDSKGLGLFITKNHVEAMGGSISVESQVGIGSTFIVKFPV